MSYGHAESVEDWIAVQDTNRDRAWAAVGGTGSPVEGHARLSARDEELKAQTDCLQMIARSVAMIVDQMPT